MAIQRMDNVLIVVEDLDAVIAFFVELGMELEGEGRSRDGGWSGSSGSTTSDRTSRCCGPRTATARSSWRCSTADGDQRRAEGRAGEHAGHSARHVRRRRHRGRRSPACAPTAPNSSARWSSTRTSIGSATSAAPRASSSAWPNSSADGRRESVHYFRCRGLARRRRPLAAERGRGPAECSCGDGADGELAGAAAVGTTVFRTTEHNDTDPCWGGPFFATLGDLPAELREPFTAIGPSAAHRGAQGQREATAMTSGCQYDAADSPF